MERSERLYIALACGLGALIGGTLMLQWAGNPFLTTLGVLIGGLVGYITYRPQEVGNAIMKTLGSTNWQNVGKEIVRALLPLSIIMVAMSLLTLSVATSVYYVPKLHEFLAIPVTGDIATVWDMSQFGHVVFGGFSLIMLMLLASSFEGEDDVYKAFLLTILIVSPFGILIVALIFTTAVVGVPTGIFYLICRYFFQIVRGVCWFVKTVVVAIHSDRRLMCLTDAATGAVIGGYTGNAVVGCLLGIVIGLANYEIVSKRILKLVPISQ